MLSSRPDDQALSAADDLISPDTVFAQGHQRSLANIVIGQAGDKVDRQGRPVQWKHLEIIQVYDDQGPDQK